MYNYGFNQGIIKILIGLFLLISFHTATIVLSGYHTSTPNISILLFTFTFIIRFLFTIRGSFTIRFLFMTRFTRFLSIISFHVQRFLLSGFYLNSFPIFVKLGMIRFLIIAFSTMWNVFF